MNAIEEKELTLYEAIEHAEERARAQRTIARNIQKDNGTDEAFDACMKCAANHDQLAAWLKELAEYRAADLVNREELSAEHSKHCRLNCYYCGYHKWDKEKATTYCELIRQFGKPQESKQGGIT